MYLVCFYSSYADKEVVLSKHRTIKAALKKRNKMKKDCKYMVTHYVTLKGVKVA